MFVGGVTLDEATTLATQHFGAWTGGAAAPVDDPRAASRPRRAASTSSIARTRRRPSSSSSCRRRAATPSDYYALLLADAVWGGGGFGTRLNLNLREDKGYSYGVFSTLALLREAGIVVSPPAACRPTRPRSRWPSSTRSSRRSAAASRSRRTSSPTRKLSKARGYAQQFESLRARRRSDRGSVGAGPADDRAAARVRRDRQGDARRHARGREEVRAARARVDACWSATARRSKPACATSSSATS